LEVEVPGDESRAGALSAMMAGAPLVMRLSLMSGVRPTVLMMS
jgi:hypothetical protein